MRGDSRTLRVSSSFCIGTKITCSTADAGFYSDVGSDAAAPSIQSTVAVSSAAQSADVLLGGTCRLFSPIAADTVDATLSTSTGFGAGGASYMYIISDHTHSHSFFYKHNVA